MESTVKNPAAALGMHPLLLVTLQLVGICIVPGALFYGMIVVTGSEGKGAGGAIVLLGFVPWALASTWLSIKFLALLVSWGGYAYRHTRKVVEDGRIGITYYLRDGQGAYFVVIDEDRRLFAVNGRVIAFDQVSRVAWETGDGKHQLKITMNSGSDPILTADLGNDDNLKTGYTRVCNSLGIS